MIVSDLPEQLLWDWLAAHRVPYDVPTSALIGRLGTVTPGPDPDPVCRLPGTRLVRHQLDDLVIDTVRLWGPPAPPTSFMGRVYDGADGHASFEAGAADLERQIGPADHVSGRVVENTNVRVARWAFGLATIDLTFWPPELNRDSGSTFAYPDPLRWKASRLSIRPAVMDGLSPAELDALATAERFTTGRVWPPGPYANAAFWRRRPPGVEDQVAVTQRGDLFVISDRTLAIPSAAIASLSLHNLTPAKGGGGSGIRVEFAGGGGAALLDAEVPFALDEEAERLRDLLGVPLSTSIQPDA